MTTKGNKQRSLLLADRPGPLKREDVLCPICWSLLFEPVGLPCNHNLCLVCYTKHVQETSLQCPCCRMRLSVWSRKAAKDNSFVDQKLWDRIKREFPKLVETRILGEDSQDLGEPDLISVLDREVPLPKEADVIDISISDGETLDLVENKEEPSFIPPRDMELTTRDGEIREELEQTLIQHREDLQNQQRAEEQESSQLIKKILDEEDSQAVLEESALTEDEALARQIDQEEKLRLSLLINSKRKLFTENPQQNDELCTPPTSSSSKTNKSGSSSSTPKSGKRPMLTSISSSSKKLKRKHRLSNQKSTSTTLNSQQDSQRSIATYFSNSQSQSQPEENCLFLSQDSSSSQNSEDSQNSPRVNQSPSKSAFSVVSPSAKKFGASKTLVFDSPSATATTATTTIYPPPSVHVLEEHNRRDLGNEEVVERDIPTPNSINLEVNSYFNFKPIRTEPKTPPKRVTDGTYGPEPTLVKTTPMKWNSLIDDIRKQSCKSETKNVPDGTRGTAITPVKWTSPVVNKIHKQAEKDIKSKATNATDGTQAPEPIPVKITPKPPSLVEENPKHGGKDIKSEPTKAQEPKPTPVTLVKTTPVKLPSSSIKLPEPGEKDIKSEPTIAPDETHEPKPTSVELKTIKLPSLIKLPKLGENYRKSEPDNMPNGTQGPQPTLVKTTPVKLPSSPVKLPEPGEKESKSSQEEASCSFAVFGSECDDRVLKVDEHDVKWISQEGNSSPSQTSEISFIRIDLTEIQKQKEEFERLRLKWVQEAEDKRVAKKLYKELNSVSRDDDNPYTLRSSLGGSGKETQPSSSSSASQSSASSSSATATPRTSGRRTRHSK